MRIVELLNDGPADDSRCEEDERQRAFGELLVSGASARFPGLHEVSGVSKWTKEDENPLFLLLRATQQAVDRAQGFGDVKKQKQQQRQTREQTLQQEKEKKQEKKRLPVQEKAQQQRKKQKKNPKQSPLPSLQGHELQVQKKNPQQDEQVNQEKAQEQPHVDPVVEKQKANKQREEKPRTKEEARGVRRRAKQRVVFRRCYYKKINTLAALRGEHDKVQREFERVLAASRPLVKGGRSMRDKFVQLVLEKETLREQRAVLLDATTGLTKTQDTLQWLVDAELASIKRDGRANSALYPTELLALEPITKFECDSIVKQAHSLNLAFELQEPNLDVNSTFGWGISSVASESDCVYTSSKHVQSENSPMELGHGTLELLVEGSSMLPLLCPWHSRNVDVSVVHSIDPDHVLVSVTEQDGQSSDASCQSLYLCACDSTEGEGCMLVIQPVKWKNEVDCSYEAATGESGSSRRCWISIKPSSKPSSDCETPESQVTIAYAIPEVSSALAKNVRSVHIDFARACRKWETALVGSPLAFE